MTNPTVGRGPLGGVAFQRCRFPDDPAAVLAQRQPVEWTASGPTSSCIRRELADSSWNEAGVATRVILEPAASLGGGSQAARGHRGRLSFRGGDGVRRIASLRERASRGRAASAHSGPLEGQGDHPRQGGGGLRAPATQSRPASKLLVVEAMKMQNELRAPRDGTISRVGVAPGVKIEVGDLLVVIS